MQCQLRILQLSWAEVENHEMWIQCITAEVLSPMKNAGMTRNSSTSISFAYSASVSPVMRST